MTRSISGGILNIDKPYGMTSMQVVRRIKRAGSFKRVGHAGTLDPIATGVVPVCFGPATRVMEYLLDGAKRYCGEILIGVSTDTYDAMGQVVAESDASAITSDQVRDALAQFRGEISQVPPMFSALKRDGKRLYDLARKGIEVEREPRPVSVYGIELTGWKPPVATVRVDCGRGFYMRSLAHDVGQMLGCGGHLKSLVRIKTGPFHLDEAVTLEEAEIGFEDGSWADLVYSPDVALGSLRTIIAGSRTRTAVNNGRPLAPEVSFQPSQPKERCRVYGVDGEFLAIVRFDPDRQRWVPNKVFQCDILRS